MSNIGIFQQRLSQGTCQDIIKNYSKTIDGTFKVHFDSEILWFHEVVYGHNGTLVLNFTKLDVGNALNNRVIFFLATAIVSPWQFSLKKKGIGEKNDDFNNDDFNNSWDLSADASSSRQLHFKNTFSILKKKRKKWQNELKIEIFSPFLHRYSYNSKKLEKQTIWLV